MRIGIGCTTYNRPECLAKWKEQIAKHTSMDNVLIYIADDSTERKGVAFRKNECLRALKDCDYIFLFDDDCYPINDSWIGSHIFSDQNHLLYLNESHIKLGIFNNDYEESSPCNYYRDCGGVFMFMTNKCIKEVGAFNEGFSPWGLEHAEYSKRIKIAGLSDYDYASLCNASKLLYSEDYSNPNHKSSITNEEKNEHFKKNFPLFQKGIERIYIPL